MTANTSLIPVWKVVIHQYAQRFTPDRWFSGFPRHTIDDRDGRSREYSRETPTVPAEGFGWLAAFKTLGAALDLVEQYGGIDHEVWAAVAERAPEGETSIWDDGGSEKFLDGLPDGTILCAKIGLLKCADDFDEKTFGELLGDDERLQAMYAGMTIDEAQERKD